MDFMTAARTGFNKLTDTGGTAGRAEFWWYFLAVILVSIVVGWVLGMFLGTIAGFVGSLVWIGLMFAATVRRLRDAGKPEMVAYAFFGIGLITSATNFLGLSLGIIASILGLVSLVLLIVLIFFLVQPSAGGGGAAAA